MSIIQQNTKIARTDQQLMSLNCLTASLNVPRRSVPVSVPRVTRVSRRDLLKSFEIPASSIPTIQGNFPQPIKTEANSNNMTKQNWYYQSQTKTFPSTSFSQTNESSNNESGRRMGFFDVQNQSFHKNKKNTTKMRNRCSYIYLLLIPCGLIVLATVIAAILSVSIKIPTSTSTSITSVTTATTSTLTSTSTTTDIPCSPPCNSQKTCIKGVCVGIGYISCTMTWSRAGDGDIVVATPNNNIICFSNTGPSNATDQGQLDVDDTAGTGPENVFWSNSGPAPPTVYPITATLRVMRSSNSTSIFTKTFTSYYKNYSTCDSASSGLLASFSYP